MHTGLSISLMERGTLIFISDTTTQYNCLELALPGSTPYTFEVFVDHLVTNLSSNGDNCSIGMRESSTGKMVTFGTDYANAVSTTPQNTGYALIADNWTSNTGRSPSAFYVGFGSGMYLKIQNT